MKVFSGVGGRIVPGGNPAFRAWFANVGFVAQTGQTAASVRPSVLGAEAVTGSV